MADLQKTVYVDLKKNEKLDIEFENVSLVVEERKKKKNVLKNVSGKFKSGELTAIMGPSGAGKTTLLNILTGFQKTGVRGDVKVATLHDRHDMEHYRKSCCYILQDDQLVPLFSVSEIMAFAAHLKLGYCISEKMKNSIISEILEVLKLTACKNTRCSSLSGGQKKRLSIALELIDNPPIMFLDEPTTGLDSLSSLQCVEMLKSLSKEGRTIVCTIHQPSATIFEMFDHVYVLANGHCIYQGDSKSTVPYLSSLGLNCPQYHNPADFLLEVANGEYGPFTEHLSRTASGTYWRKSSMTTTSAIEDSNYNKKRDRNKTMIIVKPPSELTRFRILYSRCVLQVLRNWTFTYLRLGAHIAIGLILGVIFLGFGNDGSRTISNMSFCMISCVYLAYTALMPAVHKFPSELPVLKKERYNNWYQLRTYYVAFLATNIPQQVIYSVVYCTISYYLTAQPLELWRFGTFITVCSLVAVTAECIGILLGTLVKPINGTFLGAISFAVMMCFAGFLIFFPHMPVLLHWIRYVSYMAYSFESLMQVLYGYDRASLSCPPEANYCHYKIPEAILKELGMSEMHIWRNITCMVLNIFLLIAVSYCTLKRKLSSN